MLLVAWENLDPLRDADGVVVTKEKDILGGSIYPVSGGELFCFVYNKKG
jgi:hypothetical protein